MSKTVSFGKVGMDKLVKGMDIAAEAVGGTIGPKGRNAFIWDVYTPKITNDGVTVANKVILDDPEEDAGAYVIRNVTSQTNDDVGDGTTTTAVLTQAIIHACLERPENPMEVRTSLNEAVQKVFSALEATSTKITKDDIKRVALISAEDETLASIISEVTQKLGEKAVINVEDSKTLVTDYEIVDGYEAEAGYLSPYFADQKTGKATLTEVPVLVTDRKISNVADLKPLFEHFQKNGIGSCVIVCDDIDDTMLGVLVANKVTGKFQSLVIKAHGDTLRDIEGAVGAQRISASTGITFHGIKDEHFGFAKKVVADQHKTLFLGDGVAAKDYASILEKEFELEPNIYRKKKLEERIAQLRGGIAVLRIAASTDFEREYLKLKAEDAIKAVQSALAEGIVEGGGMALWRIAQSLEGKTIGEAILKKALTKPLRKIIENAGKDYAEIVMSLPEGKGYDAKNDTYSNLIQEGIVDPAKVERKAVANAVSAAGTFCTTFVVLTDKKDEPQK